MEGPLAAALAADLDGAFPDLVAALARPVYSLGLRLCGPSDAEDVAQETFLRAYQALHEYPPDRRKAMQVRPWVLTIALNVARNRLRDGGRELPVDGAALTHVTTPNGADPLPGPDAGAEQSELRRRLIGALWRLPLPAREAVVLRHVVGCPVAEVAAVLSRPAGTVKAQVWRGLAALREDLEADRQSWEDA